MNILGTKLNEKKVKILLLLFFYKGMTIENLEVLLGRMSKKILIDLECIDLIELNKSSTSYFQLTKTGLYIVKDILCADDDFWNLLKEIHEKK